MVQITGHVYWAAGTGTPALIITAPGKLGQPVFRNSRRGNTNTHPTGGSDEETQGHQQSNILSLALEQAMNGPLDLPTQSLNSTVSIGEGLPVLPKRLLQKIWSNEYIDLSELPPAKSRPRAIPH